MPRLRKYELVDALEGLAYQIGRDERCETPDFIRGYWQALAELAEKMHIPRPVWRPKEEEQDAKVRDS